MSAHATLLEPFAYSGQQFFFCKRKLVQVFLPRHQTFSSGGLPTKENMIRSAKAITGVMNFVAMLQMLNFSR